ncbi:MAG: tRNA (adenosine(37)-N6)-threonylcarbamoyltransferase complex dimerization subunit type 1 TsaB [Candidatus Andersenbacteria bacterium]|nr:tRNA (adenosine(37)-N6)-threonylcarbamoyltransferase complex dimerization subunit type 1 TsaB [Candidatus Andersenbacteria bacterium]MBI3251173.1 tRNA (adenosine(37)-N6)-threonylcarbamoyltransferase complex dimerization subunit type 1 TsaB [Candidatus Andersenbacteria bacterium]
MTDKITLKINTATGEATATLLRGTNVLAERTWPNDAHTGSKLLEAIEQLLTSQNLTLEAVDVIEVHRGPGGFSSLRAGIVTAEILRFALNTEGSR